MRRWLGTEVANVHPVGRNGMHKYNNQDHSMYTAMLTVENIVTGARHDIWSVNVEEEYHEEKSARRRGTGTGRDRADRPPARCRRRRQRRAVVDALAEDGPARGEGGPPPSEPVVKETSEIRHAIPLAIAAALVGVVSLLTTVVVAHVLTSEQYGTLIALLGLFLVVSMPGTALLVGVVRRVSAWQTSGLGDRVRGLGEAHPPHLARHRSCSSLSVMFLVREPVVARPGALPYALGRWRRS